ncbi:ferredoxin-NADP reductase [Candidatus Paracaedimonas acanthamoebae]|nr:ferredoxin-NADP reductase [Candidatus Paracaedimonas acanthamoebae]
MNTAIKTDVVVIGAGPVGLFAIFECGMMRLKCHVVDALEIVGGQCAALYPEKPIYDIPGFPRVEASELIKNLEKQALPFNPVYHLNQQVEVLQSLEDNRWLVKTSAGTQINTKVVIIAAGCGAFGPNRPPLAGIDAYEGKSVLYYIQKREQFTNQRVVIAGGGDSAVDWALSLSEIAKKVMVVHRRPKFRAAPESEEQLHRFVAQGKIELVVPYQLDGLEGHNGQLETVIVKTLEGESRRLETDYLLPFFGLSMNLGPINDWGLNLEKHHIQVEPGTCATNQSGILAIGDIATYPHKLKLILTGFAEAAQAAHTARSLVHPGEVWHFEHSTTQGVPHKETAAA